MSRRSGWLVRPTTLTPGDHTCWSYSSDDDHREVLTRFVVEGLEAGDRVAYLGADGSTDAVRRFLDAAGVDVEQDVARRRLVLGDARTEYLPDGVFDPDARLNENRNLALASRRAGFRAFRVAAEGAWLLGDPRMRERVQAYELCADLLAARMPLIALCCYDSRTLAHEDLALTAAVHASAIGSPDECGSCSFRLYGTSDGGIAISGELDVLAAPRVRTILSGAARRVVRPIVDVSRLRFADVPGVQAIIDFVTELRACHDRVELVGASATFRKVWSLLRMGADQDVVFV